MPPSFFIVEPEVPGGWARNTAFTRTAGQSVVVHTLHVELDGWLGDALLETTPCFIVTDEARQAIATAALTGVIFRDVEVTRSDLFTDLYGGKTLPRFWWMVVAREAGIDDFGVADDLRLIASQGALATLRPAGLAHAEIHPVGS